MSTVTTPATKPDLRIARRRAVVLATLGGVMEWYDFNVYGYVAVMVSANIFSNENSVSGLLATFATFGVGFAARPIGAFVFGIVADRRGRKLVMLLSMLLMALASLIMGVTPNFSVIGVWAPVLFVFARLLQGFSAGGEFGSSAVFLTEWATPRRRGLFGSFQQVSAMGGLFFGVAVATVLTALLGSDTMMAGGWRIPFLLGALLAIVVYYLRRRLDETPIYQELAERSAQKKAAEAAAPVRQPISVARGFIVSMGVAALMAAGPFIALSYMPTFTQQVAGVDATQALAATLISVALLLVLVPLSGHLSDKWGRRPFLFAASIGWLVLAVPLFLLITNGQGFLWVLVAQLLFQIPTACLQGTGTAVVSEMFATGRRATYVSLSTAIGNAIFGGFAPYVAALLVSTTGIAISPAFYIMFIALLALVAAFLMPERANQSLQ